MMIIFMGVAILILRAHLTIGCNINSRFGQCRVSINTKGTM